MKLIKLNLEQKTEQKPENLAQKIVYFTVLYSAHCLFLLLLPVVKLQMNTSDAV